MRDPNLINSAYLVAAISFIVALRRLSSPTTARSGNLIGAAGMLIAVVATLLQQDVVSYWQIIIGMVVGAVIGVGGAQRVRMTAMPQMVALFNGVGGGAAALVAFAEFHRLDAELDVRVVGLGGLASDETLSFSVTLSIIVSALIGAVSFSGSLVAFGKLQELVTGRPITFGGQQVVNIALLAATVAAGVVILAGVETDWLLLALIAGALVFGVLFVLPIGGGDMPVVISMLNAFTGLAAAATGFALHNTVLIVSGALVGASGTLLTLLMGKAMNRSAANVVFGAFGSASGGGAAPAGALAGVDGNVRSASAEDVAIMLAYAKRVVIVPGYGMAVAQAQHSVRELAAELEKRGVDVRYAIHPVAGRMPGHMNVLLAEANVPYPQLYEMEQINPEFSRTDVALVIGANDVTNPAARTDRGSPIFGMPILDVDSAASVVVLKRGMSPGFAGVDNALYVDPKTVMLFGDAKGSVVDLLAGVKAL